MTACRRAGAGAGGGSGRRAIADTLSLAGVRSSLHGDQRQDRHERGVSLSGHCQVSAEPGRDRAGEGGAIGESSLAWPLAQSSGPTPACIRRPPCPGPWEWENAQLGTPRPARFFLLFKGVEVQSRAAGRGTQLPDPRLRGVPEEAAWLLFLLMTPQGLGGSPRGPPGRSLLPQT